MKLFKFVSTGIIASVILIALSVDTVHASQKSKFNSAPVQIAVLNFPDYTVYPGARGKFDSVLINISDEPRRVFVEVTDLSDAGKVTSDLLNKISSLQFDTDLRELVLPAHSVLSVPVYFAVDESASEGKSFYAYRVKSLDNEFEDIVIMKRFSITVGKISDVKSFHTLFLFVILCSIAAFILIRSRSTVLSRNVIIVSSLLLFAFPNSKILHVDLLGIQTDLVGDVSTRDVDSSSMVDRTLFSNLVTKDVDGFELLEGLSDIDANKNYMLTLDDSTTKSTDFKNESLSKSQSLKLEIDKQEKNVEAEKIEKNKVDEANESDEKYVDYLLKMSKEGVEADLNSELQIVTDWFDPDFADEEFSISVYDLVDYEGLKNKLNDIFVDQPNVTRAYLKKFLEDVFAYNDDISKNVRSLFKSLCYDLAKQSNGAEFKKFDESSFQQFSSDLQNAYHISDKDWKKAKKEFEKGKSHLQDRLKKVNEFCVEAKKIYTEYTTKISKFNESEEAIIVADPNVSDINVDDGEIATDTVLAADNSSAATSIVDIVSDASGTSQISDVTQNVASDVTASSVETVADQPVIEDNRVNVEILPVDQADSQDAVILDVYTIDTTSQVADASSTVGSGAIDASSISGSGASSSLQSVQTALPNNDTSLTQDNNLLSPSDATLNQVGEVAVVLENTDILAIDLPPEIELAALESRNEPYFQKNNMGAITLEKFEAGSEWDGFFTLEVPKIQSIELKSIWLEVNGTRIYPDIIENGVTDLLNFYVAGDQIGAINSGMYTMSAYLGITVPANLIPGEYSTKFYFTLIQ